MAEENWQDLLRTASRLRARGRVDEAIAAYQVLLAVKSDLPDSWYNLGWLQRRSRAFEDALESYRRALELNVREPEEVHLNRAVIYADHLHLPDEAEAELRAALGKNPAYVPALLNLGNLKEDLGDKAAATAAYERALAADPGNVLALARLAGLSHSKDLDQALEARLQGAIERPGASASERADLGFALAALLDAAGRYPKAFEAARQANADSRSARPAAYNRHAQEDFVDRQVRTFRQPLTADRELPAPLFICGMFRSGSTLVEQILASHSCVTRGGELDAIPALVDRIAGYPEAVAVSDARTVDGWRQFYLRSLPEALSAHILVTDKRPDNFLHLGLIKTLFPTAKIIHTRRNPLDNLLSLYFLHLDPRMTYALDLADSAHWYAQHERLMDHWKALYPDDIFEVDYDQLVSDPKAAIERLLKFCGLDWEDSLLDFHTLGSTVKTASVWQVREPLHARSSGRWRKYRAQLEPILGVFGKEDSAGESSPADI